MSNLYLTGLPPDENLFPKNKTKDHHDYKKIQNEYLNFLIQQESKFADIQSILGFYNEQVVRQYNKFNENKSILLRKKKEYDNIVHMIENEIVANYRLSKEDIFSNYNDRINTSLQLIKVKEHEKEIYQNMYNRLYHCNFMVKKRIEVEIVYESMNSKQISQYKIINNNALSTMKQKQEMLNQMIRYGERYGIKNCTELYEKEKQSNFLHYQVEVIKKDSNFLEKKLKKFYDKYKDLSNELGRIKQVNLVYYKENVNLKKDYHKLNVRMMHIAKLAQEKQLSKFINTLSDKRLENHNLLSVFMQINQDIIICNHSIQELDSELKSIHKKIEEKNRNSHKIVYDNQIIRKYTSEKEQNSYNISQLLNSIEKKVCLTKIVVNFLNQNCREMAAKSHTFINDSHNKPFDSISGLNEGLDYNSIRMMIELFNKFSGSFLQRVYEELTSRINAFNTINLINDNILNSNEDGILPMQIIDIVSAQDSNKQVKEFIRYQQTISNQGRGTTVQKNKDMFTTISTQAFTKYKGKPQDKVTTQAEMFKKFVNYLSIMKTNQIDNDNIKIPNELIESTISNEAMPHLNSNKEMINRNHNRLTALFSKFQNDFVVNEKVYKKANKKQSKNKVNNSRVKSRAKPQEPLINKNETTTELSEEEPENDSFEESQNRKRKEQYDINKNKQCATLRYPYFKNDPEMAKIYCRFNDIRKLEFKCNKRKDQESYNEDIENASQHLMKKSRHKYNKVESQYSLKNISTSYRTFHSNFPNKSNDFLQMKGYMLMKDSYSNGFSGNRSYNNPLSNKLMKKSTIKPLINQKKKFKYPNRLMINNKSMPDIGKPNESIRLNHSRGYIV